MDHPFDSVENMGLSDELYICVAMTDEISFKAAHNNSFDSMQDMDASDKLQICVTMTKYQYEQLTRNRLTRCRIRIHWRTSCRFV